METSSERTINTFEIGERVVHKLGFDGIVHGVIKEIRNQDGTVVQELSEADFIYGVGYMDKNGRMEIVKVNEAVLDKYVV